MSQLGNSGSNQAMQFVVVATEFGFEKLQDNFAADECLQFVFSVRYLVYGINCIVLLVISSSSNSLRRKLITLKYDTNCRLVFPIQKQNRSQQCRTIMTWLSSHSTQKVNIFKSIGHVTHQQFNIQQLYAMPTLYLRVLYLSENKQRLVPLTA